MKRSEIRGRAVRGWTFPDSASLLARRVDGIFLSDFEQGEIGPDNQL
ncbi:hypothetical protein [Bradyrhizobium ivorense]|nr:hypothetical protein [Bradyrhizobium ivorense]